MNIGIFTATSGGNLTGNLPSLNLSGVSFEAVEKKGSGPDYRITIEGAELGAAWKKISEKGTEYLSAQIDSPLFPAAVNMAIFTRDNGKSVAVWDRPEAK